MRYVGDLLYWVRQRALNEDFSVGSDTTKIEDVESGIGDLTILEFLNDGHDRLQSLIMDVNPNDFVFGSDQNVVANQEEYDPSDNIFYNGKFISVKYTHSLTDPYYYPLDPKGYRDRTGQDSHRPSFYIPRNGKILLDPIPNVANGGIRIEYYRKLDTLALRAGEVTVVTTDATSVTALTIDPSTFNKNLLDNVTDKYICVSDRDGAVGAYNIPYTSVSGSGVFTLDTHSLPSGFSVAVGDFVTVGKYTSTHSSLPDSCERYLKLYGQMRVLAMDSSNDIGDEKSELIDVEREILGTYKSLADADVRYYPELDKDLLY